MKLYHDIHTHTLFSSCSFDPKATMAALIEKAAELDLKVLGISNHGWDEKAPGASYWYKGQTIEYVFESKYAIPADTKGVKVLFGIESEYCGMTDRLGMLAETGKRFDYVLIPHTHTHMKNYVIADDADTQAARDEVTKRLEAVLPEFTSEQIAKMVAPLKRPDLVPTIKEPEIDYYQYNADFMFSSFESLMKNPEFVELAKSTVTIIAHPFSPGGETKESYTRMLELALVEKDRLLADFKLAAELNVAMDINVGTYRHPENDYMDDPMVKIMRVAREAGCKFSFGTDTHSVDGLQNIRKGELIADAIGITEDDLIDLVK